MVVIWRRKEVNKKSEQRDLEWARMRTEVEIQSRTNLNGGDLEKEKRIKIGGQVDQEGELWERKMEIQSRTDLNGGELERIEGLCKRESEDLQSE